MNRDWVVDEVGLHLVAHAAARWNRKVVRKQAINARASVRRECATAMDAQHKGHAGTLPMMSVMPGAAGARNVRERHAQRGRERPIGRWRPGREDWLQGEEDMRRPHAFCRAPIVVQHRNIVAAVVVAAVAGTLSRALLGGCCLLASASRRKAAVNAEGDSVPVALATAATGMPLACSSRAWARRLLAQPFDSAQAQLITTARGEQGWG